MGELIPPRSSTCYLLRVMSESEAHISLLVYAGPDVEHRANVGALTMKPVEFDDLVDMLSTYANVEVSGRGA